MDVVTLNSTPTPERLVCTAARGDYYDGFVGEDEYEDVMDNVVYKDRHMDALAEIGFEQTELNAKQYKLIEKLFKRGHWGPMEHPQITLGVEGISRSCMAQLTRHRHASFDVQSMRYADFSKKNAIVPASLLSEDEREERYPYVFGENATQIDRHEGIVEVEDREQWRRKFEKYQEMCFELYEAMQAHDVPNEDARFILPIGTPVNLSVSLNARMLLHIEDMRGAADAQWEIRGLTERVHEQFEEWMPMTAHLYERHGPHKLAP